MVNISQQICWNTVNLLQNAPRLFHEELANTKVFTFSDAKTIVETKIEEIHKLQEKHREKEAILDKNIAELKAQYDKDKISQQLRDHFYFTAKQNASSDFYFSHREYPIDFGTVNMFGIRDKFREYFRILKVHDEVRGYDIDEISIHNELIVHKKDHDGHYSFTNRREGVFLVNMTVLSLCLHTFPDDSYFVFKGHQYGDVKSYTKDELIKLNKFTNDRDASFSEYYLRYTHIVERKESKVKTEIGKTVDALDSFMEARFYTSYVPMQQHRIESTQVSDRFYLIDITTEKPESEYETIERTI